MDYVVVGGDSGGCTVTDRLSEDPSGWIVNTPAALFLMIGSLLNNWHLRKSEASHISNRLIPTSVAPIIIATVPKAGAMMVSPPAISFSIVV